MSKWAETTLPCPCGASSDAFSIDHQGNGFCFSGGCKKPFYKDYYNKEEEAEITVTNSPPGTIAEAYAHRGISKSSFEKYGVLTKISKDGEPIDTGFFYPNGFIKVRDFKEKKFYTRGQAQPGVYGKNVFDKGSKRVITITEGEYDAISAYQMLYNETAAVSVRSSVTAKADCLADWEYINSFDKIVINFDSDEAGQNAAKSVASLFDFKKVFCLKLEKAKDANAYLENDMVAEYCNAWRGVKRYTPDSILSTMSEFKKALEEKAGEKIADYPFEGLQAKLHGMHEGEVVLWKAEEGIGKTEVFRAVENQVLKTTKHSIGLIHLEESNGITLRGMAGYFSEKPILSPEMPASNEEVLEILEQISGEDSNRFMLHSSFDVEDEDAFIDNIRFMVVAGNCKVVFLDHISWLATGSEDKQEDERRKLDRIIQRLKLLAEELNFCLHVISHVNDDGKTRGSRYISKAANTVIFLSRNKTSADEQERIKTNFLIEKARLIGAEEGPAGFAIYNKEKLMLIDPLKDFENG